jgi:hypothetical protein
MTRRLTYRARVEALVQRLIDRLDEMDASTTDMEPDEDDDDPEEASGQPLTLCPDLMPAKRGAALEVQA